MAFSQAFNMVPAKFNMVPGKMIGNLFSHLPSDLPEELKETLAETAEVRIERIVSTGHTSPEGYWYDQDESEWLIVLQGEAQLALEDRPELLLLKPGDFVNIPAHQKHRVQWTSENEPTVWLAVFYRDHP